METVYLCVVLRSVKAELNRLSIPIMKMRGHAIHIKR
jgi:hypothetical protein